MSTDLADAMSSTTSAAWVSAWASVVTSAIAVVALVIAGWQIREARSARAQTRALADEVAQPYVVAYMEPDAFDPDNIDLVVRNFGQTAAFNVTFSTEPELRSALLTGTEHELLVLPAAIPILAPGQEWRTFWDDGNRMQSDLPARHEMNVSYRGTRSVHSTHSILDFTIHAGRIWTDRKTIHDLVSTAEKIDKKIGEFNEGFHGGLRVYTRSGDGRRSTPAT